MRSERPATREGSATGLESRVQTSDCFSDRSLSKQLRAVDVRGAQWSRERYPDLQSARLCSSERDLHCSTSTEQLHTRRSALGSDPCSHLDPRKESVPGTHLDISSSHAHSDKPKYEETDMRRAFSHAPFATEDCLRTPDSLERASDPIDAHRCMGRARHPEHVRDPGPTDAAAICYLT